MLSMQFASNRVTSNIHHARYHKWNWKQVKWNRISENLRVCTAYETCFKRRLCFINENRAQASTILWLPNGLNELTWWMLGEISGLLVFETGIAFIPLFGYRYHDIRKGSIRKGVTALVAHKLFIMFSRQLIHHNTAMPLFWQVQKATWSLLNLLALH